MKKETTLFRQIIHPFLLITATYVILFLSSFAAMHVALSLQNLSGQILQVKSDWNTLDRVTNDILYRRIDSVDRISDILSEWKDRTDRLDTSFQELTQNTMFRFLPSSARDNMEHSLCIWNFTRERLENARIVFADILTENNVADIGSNTLRDAITMLSHREALASAKRQEYRFLLANLATLDFVSEEFDNILSALNREIPVHIDRYIWWLLSISLAGMTAATLLSFISTRQAVKPIRDLSVAMKRIRKQDFSVSLPPADRNEIGRINEGVGDMLDTINRLIAESIEKEKIKHNLEWQILRDQINPHFIFNTLGCLQMTAALDGSLTVTAGLKSLSRILRNAFTQGKQFHSLRTEFYLLTEYIAIMQMRYENRIQFQCHAEPETATVQIPCLIIQPLAENAILHGLSRRLNRNEEPAQLKVTASTKKNILTISVWDNGCGIPADRMKSLCSQKPVPGERRHIGISNTDRRLRLLYGDNFCLHIESDGRSYTEAWFSIPMDTVS
jgi:sensor histidine kinase YesM